jgi:hypothetical protein
MGLEILGGGGGGGQDLLGAQTRVLGTVLSDVTLALDGDLDVTGLDFFSYDHVELILHAENDTAAPESFGLRFNGDNGANYDTVRNALTNAGVVSNSGQDGIGKSQGTLGSVPTNAGGENLWPITIRLFNAGTTDKETIGHIDSSYGSQSVFATVAWRNASAVTSVEFVNHSDSNNQLTFEAGSRLQIIGYKAEAWGAPRIGVVGDEAVMTANQAITSATDTYLSLHSVIEEALGGFDLDADATIWTCPVGGDGWYDIWWGHGWAHDTNGHTRVTEIVKNKTRDTDNVLARDVVEDPDGGATSILRTVNLPTQAKLVAGDTISISVYQDSGSPVNVVYNDLPTAALRITKKAHISGSPPDMSDAEAIAGTGTEPRIPTPAQLKLAVESHGRIRLTGATTFYLDGALGDDANDGSSSGAGAFQTIQGAVNYIMDKVDMAANLVTIEMADGAYAGGTISFVGNGSFKLNATSNDATACYTTSSMTIVESRVLVHAVGFVAGANSANFALLLEGAYLSITGDIDWDSNSKTNINGIIAYGAQRVNWGAVGTVTVTGNFDYFHLLTRHTTLTMNVTRSWTFVGTPVIAGYALYTEHGATAYLANQTLSGAVTGARYYGTFNSNISGYNTNLPGTGGSVVNGGVAVA